MSSPAGPLELTIAIPAYDEAPNIERVVTEALAELAALGVPGELLIVNDGSIDGTGALADALAERHPEVRVVHHPRNAGFSGAMRTCFRAARGEWVFLAPADGQISVSEVRRFMTHRADADIVVGVRRARQDHAGRRVLSRAFHLLTRALMPIPLREFSSVFLFRRALLDAMPFRARGRSAMILPEILFRSGRRGARLAAVEVDHHPRRAGRAKGAQLSVAVLTLLEMVRLAVVVRVEEAVRRGLAER